MKRIHRYGLILLAAATCCGGFAQEDTRASDWASVMFHYARQGGQPDKYTVQIQANGKGFYWEGDPEYNATEVPSASRHEISVSRPTIEKVTASFSMVSSEKCETRLKNIAETGQKTLVLSSNGKSSQCAFNYSDDERVNIAASTLQAIAETMQAGEHLKYKHRFDHLGLDAELDSLLTEAKEGRAIELQNVAPILQSIVDDDEMMSPSRRKAKSLLELAGIHAEAGV